MARPDESFDRILVIVTRQIGDVLLTTPLIRAAKARWPRASIDVLGFAGTLGMLRGNPDVNELVEVQPGAGWRQSWPLIRKLWRRYDLALIAQYTDRAHLYGWVAARVRSGQVPEGRASWWKRVLLRHTVELGGAQSHVVLEKLKLLDPWWRVGGEEVSVRPPPCAPLPVDLAQMLSRRYVVLHVPSLVTYKQWPLSHYGEVTRSLLARSVAVVLTGGTSAADRAAVAQVCAQCDGAIDASGRLDLNQMATLLTAAALYVGPDTSITHLAAACGIPVVALFGPIDPCLWGPWPMSWSAAQPYVSRGFRQERGNVILLQGDQPCVPCNGAGCDKHAHSRSRCLDEMSPQRVLQEASRIMATPSAGGLAP